MPVNCQIHFLQRIREPLGRLEIFWQFKNRLKRMAKRRFHYLLNVTWKLKRGGNVTIEKHTISPPIYFLPGERVRIKSREEIRRALDNWNEQGGCGFMEEMWSYCGSEQKIFKRVERFLDERDYRVKRCTGIYLLEGLICNGTVDFGPCDRSCFFFWREEWLEKVK